MFDYGSFIAGVVIGALIMGLFMMYIINKTINEIRRQDRR